MSIRYTGVAPLTEVLRDHRYVGQEAMRNSAADEIDRLRAALIQVRAVCEDNPSMATNFIDQVARDALKQPSTGAKDGA